MSEVAPISSQTLIQLLSTLCVCKLMSSCTPVGLQEPSQQGGLTRCPWFGSLWACMCWFSTSLLVSTKLISQSAFSLKSFQLLPGTQHLCSPACFPDGKGCDPSWSSQNRLGMSPQLQILELWQFLKELKTQASEAPFCGVSLDESRLPGEDSLKGWLCSKACPPSG